MAENPETTDPGFKLLLRDFNPELVQAWEEKEAFGDPKFKDAVEVSGGIIYDGVGQEL